MTLNELRYVVAVAQERNFRKAAEKCFVTQPALSLAIQKLEEELGLKIFERGKTEASVTALGQQVVEQAQRVLEEAAKVKEIASQGKDPLLGTFRLGVIFTVGPYLLPSLIPALHKLAPRMPLEIEENTTAHLEALLRNGKLDAIIVALPFGDSGIATLPLYDEPFGVAVPMEHPWAKKNFVKPKELSKERVLLLNSWHCFANQVVEACPELSRRPGDVQQGNSLETIRGMVASGLGITVLPWSACTDRFQSKLIRAIPFTNPAPSRRIALAWRRSYARGKVIEVLSKAIWNLKLSGAEMIAPG
ncbi:MAG: hydrogen peroxide-inducible genes activator [Betaproteobacteria bacterium]|nr:hydrogen peroxide-inducible genes activator [Betaproteobacteria bacterium]